jgi:azurin
MKSIRTALAAAALLAALPAALVSAPAVAAEGACKLEISSNDLMQFDRKEMRVPATCKQVEVTLKHAGKLPVQSMGHNWVLVRTADLTAVANAGISAGIKNEHVPPGDKRVLAHTKLIGGGQSTSVTFAMDGLKKGENYSYVCTFPGHAAIMRGTFVIE